MIELAPLGAGADDTERLQIAIDSDRTIVLLTGRFVLSRTVQIYRPGTTIQAGPDQRPELSWAALGANVAGIDIQADGASLADLSFVGPAAGVYVAGETLVRVSGPSVSTRRTGLRITRCAFRNVGAYAVHGAFLTDVVVTRCQFEHVGFAAVAMVSSNNGELSNLTVASIGPGTAGQLYGLLLTHDPTGWPGTRAAQPFCATWTITGNTIDGSAWDGINSHGGSNLQVTGNVVRNCARGIVVANSSGAAAGYAGGSNTILNNTVTGGTNANTGPGVVVDGGTVEPQTDTVVRGNTITGHGVPGDQHNGAILASNCRRVTVESNVVDAWGSSCVYTSGLLDDVRILANRLGGLANPADTFGYAIYSDATSGVLTVDQNVLTAAAAPARRGMQAAVLVTRPTIGWNDLYRAAVAYVLYDPSWVPRPSLVPEAFGAIGDGIQDDRPAIQACCAAAIAQGSDVYLTPGRTYLLSTFGNVGMLDLTTTGVLRIWSETATPAIVVLPFANTSIPVLGVLGGSTGMVIAEGVEFHAPGGVDAANGGPYVIGADTVSTSMAMDRVALIDCIVRRFAGAIRFRCDCSSFVATGNTIQTSGNGTSSDPSRTVFLLGLTGYRCASMVIEDNTVEHIESATALPAEHFVYTYGKIGRLSVQRNRWGRLRAGAVQCYLYETAAGPVSFGEIIVADNVQSVASDLGQQHVNLSHDTTVSHDHVGTTLRVLRNRFVAGPYSEQLIITNVRWTTAEVSNNVARDMVLNVPGYASCVYFSSAESGAGRQTVNLTAHANDFHGWAFGQPAAEAIHLGSSVANFTLTDNDLTEGAGGGDHAVLVVAADVMAGTITGNSGTRAPQYFGPHPTIQDSGNGWN